MRFSKVLVTGVFLLVLAACGPAENGPAPSDAPPGVSGSPAASLPEEPPLKIDIPAVQEVDVALTEGPGRDVYADACLSCHEGQVPKAPHRSMLNIMSPDSVYRSLTVGVMQDQSAHLTDAEKRHVAEYVTGKPLGTGDVATYPMCVAEDWFDVAQAPYGSNWGMTDTNTRLIAADAAGLRKDDFPKLKLKWAFAYPDALRARSQPTVAAGAVFVGSHNGTVFALDQQTGCVRWHFKASAEVRTGIVIDQWAAGDTDADPTLYFGDLLGNIYAISARTGELIWRGRPDDHPNATITGTPTLYNGTLYVPVSSLEVTPAASPFYPCCTFRGSVVAYDAATGEKRWQAFTIEQEPALTRQNAAGTDNFGPSGAPIWNSPAIDVARNQLYVGTGENYSSPATLTSDAIFAIDLDSGAVNWVFQATPNDAWNQACGTDQPANCPEENGPDLDFGAATMLVTASDGTDYVIAGQKSGMVHALDPDTGEIRWQNKVGRGGIQAGIHFGMAAGQDVLYIPISDMDDGQEHDEPARPGLYGLNLQTGQFIWRSPAPDICGDKQFCDPGISAAITALPDVVLAGGMDGVMRVHDAATGEIVWEHDSTVAVETVSGEMAHGGSFGGGAGPVVRDGRLFMNSGYGIYFHMPGNVLLVFEPVGG